MITRSVAAICFAIAASGCTQAPEASSAPEVSSAPELTSAYLGSAVRAICPPQQASDYFFPSGSLDANWNELDDAKRTWYSSQLSAMHEQSLSCGAPIDGYRFTWLRSFHPPVVIRIIARGDAGDHTLSALELSGNRDGDPGKQSKQLTKKLTNAQVAQLLRSLKEEQFWELPGREDLLGADGAQWIVEAQKGGKYHVVNRWSPEDGPVRRLGLMFISLSGWEFLEVY